MADDPKAQIAARLIRLKKTLREADEHLEALDLILAKEPTVGDQVKRLFLAWGTHWSEKYREDYVFAGGKDAGNFKRLLRTLDHDEIEHRIINFLRNPDPFYVKSRHSLAVFVATINANGAPPPPTRGRVGPPEAWRCPDDPPCEPGTTRWRCNQRHEMLEAKR